MAATKNRRESITEKAQRLIADERYVAERATPEYWVGVVEGDTGRYAAFAISPEFMTRHGISGGRMGCTCLRARLSRKVCSHATMAEVLREREQRMADLETLSRAAMIPYTGGWE
jgi:hypothetical protein